MIVDDHNRSGMGAGRDFREVRKNMTPQQRERLAAKTEKLLEQIQSKKRPRKPKRPAS